MQRINEKRINEKEKIHEEQRSAGYEIIYSNFNPPSISGVSAFRKYWTILFAEMQSGKTGTFLFVLFEMLIKKMVDKVIIFSGNRQTGLKKQTEDSVKEFVGIFRRHLRTDADFLLLSEEERNDKLDELDEIVEKNKIKVVWGSDLKKQKDPKKHTLFIFEESHFAQNEGMQVNKFLTKMGISATGEEGLEKSGNYVLSVSATPISELSDRAHDSQTKGLVYLKPGPTYFGLSAMRETGNIVSYNVSEWKQQLEKAIDLVDRQLLCFGPQYALMRLTKKSSKKTGAGGGIRRRRNIEDEDDEEDTDAVEEAKAIARKHNWDIRFHDSIPNTEERKQINIKNPEDPEEYEEQNPHHLKDLNDVPERHTLVFFKGKCRMGEVVPKQHISFVMETSQNPNTDVILQSFLGRMCGYKANRNVMIYLSNKVIKSPEFAKYMQMTRDIAENKRITVLPCKARNIRPIKQRKRSGDCDEADDDEDKPNLEKIIPLRFPGLALYEDGSLISENDEIKQMVLDHFHGKKQQRCENLNSQEKYQVIQEKIVTEFVHDGEQYLSNSDFNMRIAKVKTEGRGVDGKGTYHLLPEKYREAFDRRTEPSLPQACSPNTYGKDMRLFVFGDGLNDYHGFEKGDVFLDIRISISDCDGDGGGGDGEKYSPAELKRIPTTTRHEIFGHPLETGVTVLVNGGTLLGLDPETHCNVDLMHQCLRQIIQLSLPGAGGGGCGGGCGCGGGGGVICPRRINSVINDGGESTGILMTQEVYDATKPGGRVFLEIKAEFNVDLVLKKGKNIRYKIADVYVSSLIKFIEISW